MTREELRKIAERGGVSEIVDAADAYARRATELASIGLQSMHKKELAAKNAEIDAYKESMTANVLDAKNEAMFLRLEVKRLREGIKEAISDISHDIESGMLDKIAYSWYKALQEKWMSLLKSPAEPQPDPRNAEIRINWDVAHKIWDFIGRSEASKTGDDMKAVYQWLRVALFPADGGGKETTNEHYNKAYPIPLPKMEWEPVPTPLPNHNVIVLEVHKAIYNAVQCALSEGSLSGKLRANSSDATRKEYRDAYDLRMFAELEAKRLLNMLKLGEGKGHE